MPPTNDASTLPIAVIGGGFTGSIVALQLRRKNPFRPVLLFESSTTFGPGLAYATPDPRHWLNVCARKMSAYPDAPNHFVDWLQATGMLASSVEHTPSGLFVPRRIFGRYIEEELRDAADLSAVHPLVLVSGEVTDVVQSDGGFDVVTRNGEAYAVAGVVLALGYGQQKPPKQRFYFPDPWHPDALQSLDPDRAVAVIGTGLTMVDIALALERAGLRAPIFAISRRGLLPRTHAPSKQWPKPALSPTQRASINLLLKHVRREVALADQAGIGWRAVVDALRPLTQEIWHHLPDEEKARFLRHLRPWWDVHRHRMAPPAADIIRGMTDRGALVVLRGRVIGIDERSAHAEVRMKLRGEPRTEVLRVQRIIDASRLDHQSDEDPLQMRLRTRGLVRPGPLGIGIDVDYDLRAIAATGEPHTRLWALGPIARGVFWECTAVPDIRSHAEGLAIRIAREQTLPES